jgi:molecular chaperone GrpE
LKLFLRREGVHKHRAHHGAGEAAAHGDEHHPQGERPVGAEAARATGEGVILGEARPSGAEGARAQAGAQDAGGRAAPATTGAGALVAPPEPDVEGLGRALAEREQEVARLSDRSIRLQADLENVRKRAEREREDVRRAAAERVASRLLEVVDDLDRAMEHAPQGRESRDFVLGVGMIRARLLEALAAEGVAELDCLGKPFDPICHEAVARECGGSDPGGTVTCVLQKGYTLNGKVIRYPRVRVAVPEPPRSEGARPSDVDETKED